MTTSLVVLTLLAGAGLVSIAVAWRGVAPTLLVATQLPYVVSGALGGAAVLGFALGLIAVQASRRAEARERAQLGRVTMAAADLLATLRNEVAR